MKLPARIAVLVVAALHAGFFVLESLLWTTDVGRGVFGAAPEFAATTKALACNQGVYNLFLAAGLVFAVAGRGVVKDVAVARAVASFVLGCVVVAGVVGAATVDPGILVVQSLPAVIALVLVRPSRQRR